MRAWVWEMWETNVIEIDQDWYILSIAYKWSHEDKVHILSLPQYHGFRNYKPLDDKLLLKDFQAIIDEADFLIGHNSAAFDRKKINARFLVHGLTPPSPTKEIDTLKAARSIAKFASNKLDDLGNALGFGRKLAHTGKHLWFAAMRGERLAWKMMEAYNKQDVLLLEKLYHKLRPYISNHPNLNIISRQPGSCPKCGSNRLQKRGYSYTRISEIPRLQCQDCGAWSLGEGMRLDVKVKVR